MNVQYEDFSLELLAAGKDGLKVLDDNGINFRKQYFMRRALGTTYEFAEEFLSPA